MRRRDTWALQKKANGWYLVWTVPKVIRDLPMFGGRRLYTKTLQTSDLREAQRKRDLIVANFDHLVAQAEEAPKRLRFNAYIEEIQKAVREAEQRAELVVLPDDDRHESTLVEPEGVYHAYDLEAAIARGDEVLADAIRLALYNEKHVQNKYAITLREAAASFIKAEKDKKVKGLKVADAATLSRAKHGAESLAAFIGNSDVLLKDIERRDVTLWLESLASDKKDSTRVGYLSALSRVWEACYLARMVEGDSPFRSVGIKSTSGSKSYEPFTLEEMAQLVEKATPALRMLVKFGLVTGCRLSEIVGLDGDSFEIKQGVPLVRIKAGKTANSIRAIPLPLRLWEELRQHVVGNLWPTPDASKNPHGWSDRFGKLKKEVTGTRDRSKGFHSFRGMAITAYHKAGVPEDVTAPIVGHGTKGLTLSYGLYSSGHDYSHQLQAVETMLASDYMSQFLKLFNK